VQTGGLWVATHRLNTVNLHEIKMPRENLLKTISDHANKATNAEGLLYLSYLTSSCLIVVKKSMFIGQGFALSHIFSIDIIYCLDKKNTAAFLSPALSSF
jgi:hypothetical protein